MLRHWSQFVPDMSADIRGHEALRHQQQQVPVVSASYGIQIDTKTCDYALMDGWMIGF